MAGEATAELCMFHLMVEIRVRLQLPTPSSMRHVEPTGGTDPGLVPRSTDTEWCGVQPSQFDWQQLQVLLFVGASVHCVIVIVAVFQLEFD